MCRFYTGCLGYPLSSKITNMEICVGISKENIQKSLFQSVAGKWVNVVVAHAGDEYVLSKYPWGEV